MSNNIVYIESRQESESERDCDGKERSLTSDDVTCLVANLPRSAGDL